MEARSKTIEAWFSLIEQGQVKLPRFQRHEAWRPADPAHPRAGHVAFRA